MGNTITVRGLDDELHRRLKEQARAHHRSMEAEARAILAAGIGKPPLDVPWFPPGVEVELEAGEDWIDRARRLLGEAWNEPDWDDEWLAERHHEPSREATELGG